VAKEILNQINKLNRFALHSWGVKNKVYDDESITFEVNGSKTRSRSRLQIRLNGNDYYDIELFRIVNQEKKIDQRVSDVGCENLVQAIDKIVG